MTCEIIGIGESKIEDIVNLSGDRKFRKATVNMKLSYCALQKALDGINNEVEKIPSTKIALFVASGHGELESTKSFLKGVHIDSKPSPIAFQNSLHNSILGFVSNTFNFDGIGVTFSDKYFSGEDAICVAMDYISLEECDLAIVIGVNSIVPDFKESMSMMYPKGVNLSQGAGVLVIANAHLGIKNSFNAEKRILLKNVNKKYEQKIDQVENSDYFDTNIISLILDASLREEYLINSSKPDGCSSVVELEYISEASC